MADAADLKSAEGFLLYGFESRLRHHLQIRWSLWYNPHSFLTHKKEIKNGSQD